MKKTIFLLSSILLALSLTGCGPIIPPKANEGNVDTPFDMTEDFKDFSKSKINENSILVESTLSNLNGAFTKDGCGVIRTEKLFNSKGNYWHKVILKDNIKSYDIISKIRSNRYVISAELDYLSKTEDITKQVNSYDKGSQYYLDTIQASKAWDYMDQHGSKAGGDENVVVAVIDTGVDINHQDLKNNIWVNTDEIPNNNIDDDNNGYVDDVVGINCVDGTTNPMDDNGHGTHVAGIIAAENNNIGVTGIAYNCKIMPIKAGNSSGHFTQSSIVEAINYASKNGADVINMSFGGEIDSNAVREVLDLAQSRAVLVSAAGNEGCQNEKVFNPYISKVKPSYPAGYNTVIGVMATDKANKESVFTNFDSFPNSEVEYEIYAPGEDIYSTFLNGKYEKLSGTSMAAPIVSGIAALLKSTYKDINKFSSKYIYSQIVNNTIKQPELVQPLLSMEKHSNNAGIVNSFLPISKAPKPSVSFYKAEPLDSKTISDQNNGDGIIDAGETFKIGVYMKNAGGVASNISLKLRPINDPFFEVLKDTTTYSDIGTYSLQTPGEIMDENGKVIDYENYFLVKALPTCPHDYVLEYTVDATFKNGMDASDTTNYSTYNLAPFHVLVSSGYLLPKIIDKDTTLTNDKLYIITESLFIQNGVTLKVNPGVKIQLFLNANSSYYASNVPGIFIDGTVQFMGTSKDRINVGPSSGYKNYAFAIKVNEMGNINCSYVNFTNMSFSSYSESGSFDHCRFEYNPYDDGVHRTRFQLINGSDYNLSVYGLNNVSYSEFINTKYNTSFELTNVDTCLFNCVGSVVLNEKAFNCVIKNDGKDSLDLICMVSNGTLTDNLGNFLFLYNEEQRNNIANTIKFYVVGNGDYILNNFEFRGISSENIDYVIGNNLMMGYYNKPAVIAPNKPIDNSKLFPHVIDVRLFNEKNKEIDIISGGTVTFNLTFSRPMDTTIDLGVYFATNAPYTDSKINGNYIDSLHWKGKYSFENINQNGTIKFYFTNGYSLTDNLSLVDTGSLFVFKIDVSSVLSSKLTVTNIDSKVQLSWEAATNHTLMGYSVYRSDIKDGNYVKVNPAIIDKNECKYVDDSILPGNGYWYIVASVFSDFSEKVISDKTYIQTKDTKAPFIAHDPVGQGYTELPLNIKCTASDNIDIKNAKVYYRTKGDTNYKYVIMQRYKDEFIGKIPSYELDIKGLEYYIEMDDGINVATKGTANNPYSVIISKGLGVEVRGDVDGDGYVTMNDVDLMMKHISGEIILDNDQFERADLDDNMSISSSEALRLILYINGESQFI